MQIVTGLFEPSEIREAIDSLVGAGQAYEDLSLMSSAADTPDFLAGHPEQAAASGAAAGAVLGGFAGALGAWVASAIPGFQAVSLAGLMATSTGAAIGTYLGSIYSMRADGQTRLDLKNALQAGQVLLVVRAEPAEAEQIAAVLEQHNGRHVEAHQLDDSEGAQPD